jgi:uncharacterized protein (DUF1501 family)
MKNANHSMDRRGFLRMSGLASAAAAFGIGRGTLAGTSRASLPTIPPPGYRATVILNLAGGADSHAFVVPMGAEHAAYAAARGPLAVPERNLLPLASGTTGGRELGLHANLSRLKALYDQGRLAIVPNVGSLIEPLDAAQFRTLARRFPKHLFAHNTQTDFWQQGRADRSSSVGWAGLASDSWASTSSPNAPINVSLGAAVRMQTGYRSRPYTIRAAGVTSYHGLASGSRRATFEHLIEQESHENALVREYARTHRSAREQHELVAAALAQAPSIRTAFPQPRRDFTQFNLPGQLLMVARLIAAQSTLGAERQVFYVELGGWDTHHDPELALVQEGMLEVDGCLGAFYDALVELGVEDSVTIMTISEFGRSLTSNGRGSDHGWGGHCFVLGGSVVGGRVHGEFPSLTLGSNRDAGAGRLVPTTSFDQYTATTLQWMGLSESQLHSIYPTLRNFPSTTLRFLG